MMRIHNQLQHPHNTSLMRFLRRAMAKPEVVKAAQWLICTVCGDAVRVLILDP